MLIATLVALISPLLLGVSMKYSNAHLINDNMLSLAKKATIEKPQEKHFIDIIICTV